MFVRNLPYSCGDKGLEEAFSEIGPVKEAFIVAEKKGEGGKSKGFGFVHFALAEDAATAVSKSGTFVVEGRPVTIDVAKQKLGTKSEGLIHGKPIEGGGGGGGDGDDRDARGGLGGGAAREDDGDDSDSDAPKTTAAGRPRDAARARGDAPGGAPRAARPQRSHRKPSEDEKASLEKAARTVAIGGLKLAGEPDGIDPTAAIDAARAIGDVEDVVSPAPVPVVASAKLRNDGCRRGVALVTYARASDARRAVAELHRAMPGVGKRKAQKMKGALKAGAGGAVDEGVEMLWARALGGEGARPKSWRVIVRNVSFKAAEAEIRAAMSAAGFVWELTIPKDFHGKPKGFAFAAYTRKADAERAVKEVNATAIAGRQIAVDWAMSKHEYNEAQLKQKEEEGAEEESEEGSDGEDDDGSGSESESESGDDSGSEYESESESSSESESESSESDDEDEEAPEEDADPDAMTRRVMNTFLDSADANDGESDGKVKYASRKEARNAAKAARIEKAKARAAARDAEREAKDRRRDAAAANDRDGDGDGDSDSDSQPPPLPGKGAKTPPPAGASVFVRDLPTDASKQSLFERMQKFGKVRSCRVVLDKTTGRSKGTAFVDFVDAASASRAIEAAGKVEGGGVKVAGRRLNIALAVSATDAADLATAKSKAFATDAKKRRDGPRDNRNLYLATEGQIHEEGPAAQGVSREDIMKRRRAKEEQKMKLKNPNFFISKNRLQVRNVPPEVDQKQLKKIFHDAVLQRATKANPKVLHARLLFDNTRPDANGKPRSRGIGFVEFDAHDHALAALRTLNNNPTIFTAAKRPIVEFAVEDARAVKKLERRRDGLNKAQRERNSAEGEEGKKPGGPKADRTARRIQKRKERKEDRKTAAAAARGDGDGGGGGGGGGGGDDGEENPAAAAKKKTKKKRKVEEPKPKQPRQERAAQKQKQKQKPQRSREPRRDRDEDLINDADLGPAPKKRRGGERRDRVDDLVDMYFGKR